MKRHASIYSVIFLAAFLPGLFGAGCITTKKDATTTEQAVPQREYDPLGLPQDRRIVSKPTENAARQVSTAANGVALVADSMARAAADSVSGQVYRVQLFTSNLFGEAKVAANVAEEIFDQPVYLDYDVPYFKVRVGNFRTRREAERYEETARGAGYASPLVVSVAPLVKQAEPVYNGLGTPASIDTGGQVEPTGGDSTGGR